MLASDGVWEFISSQEAIDIVNGNLEEGTMKVRHCQRPRNPPAVVTCQSYPLCGAIIVSGRLIMLKHMGRAGRGT